jgi:hypothetical protein
LWTSGVKGATYLQVWALMWNMNKRTPVKWQGFISAIRTVKATRMKERLTILARQTFLWSWSMLWEHRCTKLCSDLKKNLFLSFTIGSDIYYSLFFFFFSFSLFVELQLCKTIAQPLSYIPSLIQVFHNLKTVKYYFNVGTDLS